MLFSEEENNNEYYWCEVAEKYMEDVYTGNIVTCDYVKLAVERQYNDIQRERTEDFPYYFDFDAAEFALRMMRLCRHTKGDLAGQNFQIQPYQAFRHYCIWGWKKVSDRKRRFTRAYNEIARKGGKTEESGFVGIMLFLFDKEHGAEIYTAATKEEQAKISFRVITKMMEYLRKDSASIRRMVEVWKKSIIIPSTGALIKPLGRDSDTEDGLNPNCGIIDEYHAHKTSDLYDVIETGMGARSQPLIFITTTAGLSMFGPCFNLRKVCIEILQGKKKDESTFALIYTLDEDDDWADENVWIKANPNIGVTPKIDYMRIQCQKAKNEGGVKQNQFKTKNLNIWTQSGSGWIDDKVYLKCNLAGCHPLNDIERFRNRKCWGGLDLASTTDVTALALIFEPEEEKSFVDVLMLFWIPEDTAYERSRADEVAYIDWITEGWIKETPGNVTDYDFIKNDIEEIAEIVDLQSIAYDRWNSSQLVIGLTDEGFEMSPFGQGFRSMSTPTKGMKRLILSRQINHGGNPVLRWMFGNVEIKIDPSLNEKIDKKKSTEKVDGAVASVMALGEMLTNEHANDLSVLWINE